MRLFIEAALEPKVLDRIWAVGRRMQADPNFPEHSVRWVKREALHLTLRFLGEVEQTRLADIPGALAELEGGGRFELTVSEVGTFGGRRPRVVWVGLEQDDGYERLHVLRRRLDDALSRSGFEVDSGAYRPHLTLGRVRRQATRSDLSAIRAAVESAAKPRLTSSVNRVALVESTLLTDGPRYRRLSIAEL